MIKRLFSHIVIISFVLCFFLSPTNSSAGQVNLAWDPPDISTDVTGYMIHYGTASGSYSQGIDVGNTTSYTVSNLIDGQTYYFAVTAYNAVGYESVYSNEVSIVLPRLLYANYGAAGLWQWDGSAWFRINTGVPASMVASGTMLYADYGAAGLWQWDGSAWLRINTGDPASMVASGSMLYANYGAAGLWQWNGSAWSKINAGVLAAMVASGTMLYADYGAAGLWKWNGGTWTRINTSAPESMVTSGTMLYANYGTAGLWKWDGSTWSKINVDVPGNVAMSF